MLRDSGSPSGVHLCENRSVATERASTMAAILAERMRRQRIGNRLAAGDEAQELPTRSRVTGPSSSQGSLSDPDRSVDGLLVTELVMCLERAALAVPGYPVRIEKERRSDCRRIL